MALALASCLAVLLLAEAGLRLIHPKYEHLAHGASVRDTGAFMREPGHRRGRRHPDTGKWHPILVNSLGLRQHRDFTAAALESAVNIGVFGDSFTDNVHMAAEFSFTEPLDYLLNVEREAAQPGREKARPSFNVLNFGHRGWGTAQSMLRYEGSGLRGQVHHVYYIHSPNDLVENVTWGLSKGDAYHRPPWRFRLDDAGQLERVEAGRGHAFALNLLAQLHLSYLALDAISGFSADAGLPWVDPPPTAFPVFRQLLRRFKQVVEADGASFHLVWLPVQIDPLAAAIVSEEGVDGVSLMDCFAERDPSLLGALWLPLPYRFENDWHWNEAGNRLAAMCLNRFLEPELGLPPLSDEAVEAALSRYYSAFEAPPGAGPPANPTTAAIRARYAPLVDGPASMVRAPQAPQAGQLIVRATFDVYLHDGWLAYVKPDCDRVDFDPIFFLHVVPADAGDLPPERSAYGFDNLDFGANADASCAVWTKLPGYAMERLRTGQYVGHGDGVHEVLWEGEHVLAEGWP